MSAVDGTDPPGAGTASARTLASGGALNLVGAVVSAAAQFLLVLLVTRAFPADAAGQFFAATSVFLLLVGLGRLGSGIGLVYFVSRLRALGDHDAVGALLRTALVPVAVAGVLLAAGLLVWADPVAELIAGDDSETTVGYLRWLAVFIPFAALLEGVLGATRGHGDMTATVVVEKTARPIAQLGGLGIVALAGGVSLLGVAWCLPYLPAFVAAFVWLVVLRRRDGRGAASRGEPPSTGTAAVGLAGRYWRFTVPRAVAGLGQVALQRLDVVIVAAILGPAQAAVYVAATRLVALGTLGIQALSMAVQPQVAAHHARGETTAVNHLYSLSTAWLMLATWPLYLIAIAFAPTLLGLFGSGYDDGSSVLVILAAASLFSTGCGVVDVMLTMAGKSTWILGNVTLALATNVALNLLLVPRMGVEGAAVAWAAAIVVNNALPLTQLWLSSGLHPASRASLVAGVATVLGYGPVSAASIAVLGQGGAALAVAAAVGTIAYVALVAVFRRTLQLEALLAVLPYVKRWARSDVAAPSSR